MIIWKRKRKVRKNYKSVKVEKDNLEKDLLNKFTLQIKKKENLEKEHKDQISVLKNKNKNLENKLTDHSNLIKWNFYLRKIMILKVNKWKMKKN